MNIVFLCGSLEKGSDGVGDYTRELASACARLGIGVSCIAINDPYVSASYCHSQQASWHHQGHLSVFRFSRDTSWIIRIIAIRHLLNLLNPGWVSLQYVPFSFGIHGIPCTFTCLSFLLRGQWQWHCMFHELWIDGSANIKLCLVEKSQRFLLKALVWALKPKIVDTSIDRYKDLLSKAGIAASIRPLHSNIPVLANSTPATISSDSWTFVFFGSLDRQWQHEPLFSLIESARIANGTKQCIFLRLGRVSAYGSQLWKYLSSRELMVRYPAFNFVDGGELSESDLSASLLNASFGISMAPLQWIGKSSGVAVMIEHGLPVIVPSYDVSFDAPPLASFSFAEQLLFIDPSLPFRLQRSMKFPIQSSALRSAQQLLELFGS